MRCFVRMLDLMTAPSTITNDPLKIKKIIFEKQKIYMTLAYRLVHIGFSEGVFCHV